MSRPHHRLEFAIWQREPASKRVFDIVIAFLSLIALLPVLLVASAVIKLTSPGPIFYFQARRGLHGQVFNICKLRTLAHDRCDWASHPEITAVADSDRRVFSFGWWLRNRGLDEIPQLWNVLRGEMSIVGPRPHALAHEELYLANIPGYHARYAVKPGITGWAQVNGSRGTIHSLQKAEQRLAFDLEYIGRRSLLLDLRIVLRTLPLLAVSFGRRPARPVALPVADRHTGPVDRWHRLSPDAEREAVPQPAPVAFRATD
jgi:putative colanic acid biosynthesis UDP-glucose lipid carrier transferase